MMIPFLTYSKEYVSNKTAGQLEEKFSELEQCPESFYHEIQCKQLKGPLKKYRFFVPFNGLRLLNVPVTFNRTKMTVEITETKGKTLVSAKVFPNPAYILLFLLPLIVLIMNACRRLQPEPFANVMVYLVCISAAIILDRMSKKILLSTFERFI